MIGFQQDLTTLAIGDINFKALIYIAFYSTLGVLSSSWLGSPYYNGVKVQEQCCGLRLHKFICLVGDEGVELADNTDIDTLPTLI